MTNATVTRYDEDAEAYERYWAPVLDATTRGLIERVTGSLTAGPGPAPHVLDIGTGSGVLALAARERWPGALVTGADPSIGMLGMAARRATLAGVASDDPTLTWVRAMADALPLPDASQDLVLSSFALQLVPDRPAVLREVRRVLRPGGTLALVTWLEGGPEFRPSTEFDEAVMDLGIPEPGDDDEEEGAGDFRSSRAAADEVRRAGFERASARDAMLAYAWTPESYLAFKQHYDEAWLFELLADTPHAARLESLVRDRFAALPREAFVWRAPVVSVVARRPGAHSR